MRGTTLIAGAMRAAGRVPMPTWIGYAAAGLVLLVAAAGLWLTIRSAARWDLDDDDGAEDGGRGGGGGPKVPRGPSPKPAPDWWPEFERAFASYMSARLAPAEREVGPSRAGLNDPDRPHP